MLEGLGKSSTKPWIAKILEEIDPPALDSKNPRGKANKPKKTNKPKIWDYGGGGGLSPHSPRSLVFMVCLVYLLFLSVFCYPSLGGLFPRVFLLSKAWRWICLVLQHLCSALWIYLWIYVYIYQSNIVWIYDWICEYMHI